MKKFGGGKAKSSPKMNVTPLVDVVLVLLIIFMVAIPSMENNAQVELPQMMFVDDEEESTVDPVVVSLATVGGGDSIHYFFEQDDLGDNDEGYAALQERLVEVYETSDPRRRPRVLIRGDAEMQYADLRKLFKMVQEVGFLGAALRVGERRGDGDGEG